MSSVFLSRFWFFSIRDLMRQEMLRLNVEAGLDVYDYQKNHSAWTENAVYRTCQNVVMKSQGVDAEAKEKIMHSEHTKKRRARTYMVQNPERLESRYAWFTCLLTAKRRRMCREREKGRGVTRFRKGKGDPPSREDGSRLRWRRHKMIQTFIAYKKVQHFLAAHTRHQPTSSRLQTHFLFAVLPDPLVFLLTFFLCIPFIRPPRFSPTQIWSHNHYKTYIKYLCKNHPRKALCPHFPGNR